MKKLLPVIVKIVVMVSIILTAVFCSSYKYDEEWIIGKSLQEIEERYGKIPILMPEDDRLPGGTRYGAYIIEEDVVTYSGTKYGKRLTIWFNENDIATSTRIESNGKGG